MRAKTESQPDDVEFVAVMGSELLRKIMAVKDEIFEFHQDRQRSNCNSRWVRVRQEVVVMERRGRSDLKREQQDRAGRRQRHIEPASRNRFAMSSKLSANSKKNLVTIAQLEY